MLHDTRSCQYASVVFYFDTYIFTFFCCIGVTISLSEALAALSYDNILHFLEETRSLWEANRQEVGENNGISASITLRYIILIKI